MRFLPNTGKFRQLPLARQAQFGQFCRIQSPILAVLVGGERGIRVTWQRYWAGIRIGTHGIPRILHLDEVSESTLQNLIGRVACQTRLLRDIPNG